MLRRCRAHPLHLARIHTTSVRRHASSSASTRTNTRLTAPGESGMMFEKAVIRSLETAAHLHVVAHCETTQADGGVDFRARWPGIPAQVCVQCKSSSRTFPVNLIREFEGEPHTRTHTHALSLSVFSLSCLYLSLSVFVCLSLLSLFTSLYYTPSLSILPLFSLSLSCCCYEQRTTHGF